jgi:hypothetical protein
VDKPEILLFVIVDLVLLNRDKGLEFVVGVVEQFEHLVHIREDLLLILKTHY